MKFILLSILVILAIRANAQIEWGGYTWDGNCVDYAIEEDGSIGLEAMTKESPTLIYSEIEELDSIGQWTIDATINTTTSSSNMMRIYIGAPDNKMENGLNVMIGSADDCISLYNTRDGKDIAIVKGKAKFIDYKAFKVSITIERSKRADGTTHFAMTSKVEADGHKTTDKGEGNVGAEDMQGISYIGIKTYYTSTRKSGTYMVNSIGMKKGIKEIEGEEPPVITPSTGSGNASTLGWKGMTYLFAADEETKMMEIHADSVVNPAIMYKQVEKLDTIAEWSFTYIMNNTVSGSNLMRVYLSASDTTMMNGLNVTIGTADKNICLANTVNGTNKILIRGEEDILEKYPQIVNVIVRRSMNIDGSYHYLLITNTETKTAIEECEIEAKDIAEEKYIGIYAKYTSGRKTGTYYISDIETDGHLDKEETIVDIKGFYRGCVVINEVMANPSDELGLPNQEYIELYNNDEEAINLLDWTIENGTTKGRINDIVIPAKSYVLLCGKTHVTDFEGYEKVAYATPWPTLSNSNGRIVLRNTHSKVADYMEYDSKTLSDSHKKDGGWSMERVDTYNISNERSNWRMSEDMRGGTPSERNSVEETNIDTTAPQVLTITSSKDGKTLYVTTSEPMDTTVVAKSVKISGVETKVEMNTLDNVTLSKFAFSLSEPISAGRVYEVSGIEMEDLAGNKIENKAIRTAVASELRTDSEIVINEIMANATTATYDYVEIYNKGTETYDLRDVYFGMMKDDELKSCNCITLYSRPIYPGDYIVICGDSLKHVEKYDDKHKEWVVENTKMGNLPTDGTFAIVLRNGKVVDKVDYSAKMHSSLLSDVHDVALERIKTEAPTNDMTNWTSASEYCNYATPTAKNSQNRDEQEDIATEVEMRVRRFTPDGDGVDDEMVMAIRMGDGQWAATMKIYNATGEVVAVPYNNRPMPVSGEMRWNGRSDDGTMQGPGTYIVYVSAWQTGGRKKEYKKTCVIGVKKE